MHNLAKLLEIAKQAFQSGENVSLQLSDLTNNVLNHQQIIEFSYELQAGTYIIRIESEKYSDALKFIKAK